MYIQSLLAGLISVLTPNVFFMTLFLIIGLSKINLTRTNRVYIISTFCTLIVIFYAIIGFLLNDITPVGLNSFSSSITIKYIFVILNIVLGLWLLGFFKVVSSNIESNWLFISAVIGIMSIVFTGTSFSGTGPIIGTLLIANSESTTIIDTVVPLLVFAFGLIIPIGFTVFFLSKLISRNKEKKWLKVVQILTGGIKIIMTTIGLFLE